MKRVAVVTGANKGIGLAIVRGLCKSFDGDVFLTARDESRGQEAVRRLESEGLKPRFHQLDITDRGSIVSLRDFLQDKYHGLDVLVNNAAVLFYDDSPLPLKDQIKDTININYFANLDACQVLFPLLRPHARVVNMSSGASKMAFNALPQETSKKFVDPKITLEELSDLMSKYIKSAESGKLDENGFCMRGKPVLEGLPPCRSDNGMGAYCYSKLGMNVMTILQQTEFDQQKTEDVIINACTPGYVNTDMTHGNGTLSVEEGAVSPLYLSLLPPNVESPRGLFIRGKVAEDWTAQPQA